MFAIGILLFEMISGRAPFASAKKKDPWFNCLQKSPSVFWNGHDKTNKNNNITMSDEFKDLFVKMMSDHPKKRPNVDEIRNHPFMSKRYDYKIYKTEQ
jgi:serine/threonine protein kinase